MKNNRHETPVADLRFPPSTTFDYFGDVMVIVTNDIYTKRMLKNYLEKNKKATHLPLDFDKRHVVN